MCNKNTWKYIVDIGLLISGLLVIITGIIKFKSFLAIFGASLNYAEMPMRMLAKMHDWSGLAMTILVIIHLILNWDWIIATTKNFFEKDEVEVKKKKR